MNGVMKPIIVLSCIFIAGSLAASSDGKCAAHCSGIATKFRYQTGTSYNYKYESETKVQLTGIGSRNTPTVNLDASVKLSVVDTCEWTLKLSDVRIRGPTPQQLGADWQRELEKSPTSFSFDDGEIKNICPSTDEPDWATNIKRGILSTFQVAHDSDSDIGEYETDVTGRCPTTYSLKQGTIVKTKNLLECFDHVTNHSGVRLINYDVRSNFQNLPVADAKQECKYTLQREVIGEAACTETHSYLPFRNENKGGVVATITTKLRYANEDRNVVKATPGERKTMLFDDTELLWVESRDAVNEAKATLKQLCTTASNDVRPETPDNFAELVYEMKKMSVADVKSFVQSAQGECPKAKKFITDALPNCGSTGCVSVMTDILGGRGGLKLTPTEEKNYFAGLALTAHPTKEMVKAVTDVISNIPSTGLYGVTAMVNTYCSMHTGCENVAEVKQFVQKYNSLLSGWSPQKPIAQAGNIIDALRALGNLGYVTDGTNDKLKFVKEKNNHIDVRLAGLQSLRRTPLTPNSEKDLSSVFTDPKEDVEVRLSAFLILMNLGVSEPTLSTMMDSAFDEHQLYQIQSFVGSYVRQVRDSKDPSKEDLRHTLARVGTKLPKKGFDPRKYSRYYETSHFDYDYNVGGHVDSVVIFTPESYMPKQAHFNLTVDVFGSEINLLEVGVRADHLDEAFDELFGPEGYFTNPVGFYTKEDKKKPKSPKVQELQNGYDKERKPKSGLDLSTYIRVFGDEMVYRSKYNIPLIDTFQKAINPGAAVNMMSQQNDISSAIYKMPIDSIFTVPVLSGLPLRFDVNGTIALNLDVSTKADLRDVIKGNADVKLMLKPSAATELAAQLAIWTGPVKSGVRLTKTMHTSTAGTFTLQAKNRESITAKLEFPNDKLEIANVESHIFTVVNNVLTEEKGVPNRKEGLACTPDNFAKVLGFKICSKGSIPDATRNQDAPYFPLSGPSESKLYIEKTDRGLKSYEFNANWKTSPTGRTVKLSLNTPGSQVDREMTLDFDYVRDKSINAELKTPFKKVKAVGTLEPAGADKTKGKISVTVDQSKEYAVIGSMERTALPENGKRWVYDAQVTAPNLQQPGTLKATAERTPGKKSSIDMTIDKVFSSPFEWKGSVEKSAAPTAKYMLNSQMKCPKFNNKVSGLANVQSIANMDYNLEFEYQRPGTDQTPHKLTYAHKHTFNQGDKTFKLAANSKFTSSWYPDFNDGYDVTVDRTKDKLEIQAALLDNDQKGLIYNQVSQIKPNDVTTTVTLQYPKQNFNYKSEIVYRNLHPKEFLTSVKLEDVVAKKEGKALVRYTNKRQDQIDWEGEALLKTPAKELRVFRTTKETRPGEYTSSTTIQWDPAKKADIQSTFKATSRNDWEVKANINMPGTAPLEFFKKFKFDKGATKYITYLKQQSKTMFDINVDAVKDGDVKTNVKGTLKVDYDTIKVDHGINGFYENLPVGKRVSGTILKQGQDYMKAEVIMPKDWGMQSDKHIKVGTVWGLPQQPKELLYEHKMSRTQAGHLHETTLKMDIPDASYKLDVKRKHEDARTINILLSKKNSPLVEIDMGRTATKQRDPNSYVGQYSANVMVKTYAPMNVRHMTGDYKVNIADTGVTANLKLDSKTDNQKLYVDLSWNRKDGGRPGAPMGIEKSLSITANDATLRFKNTGSVPQGSPGQFNGFNADGELEWTKAADKKKWTWNVAATRSKVDAKFTTPSQRAPTINVKAETKEEGKKQIRSFETTWANQKVTAQVSKETADNYYDADLTIDTTLDALKTYKHHLKYDTRTGAEAVFDVNWNNANKIAANFLRATERSGDEKWNIGAEAKIGAALDWKTSTSATWNPATGKYVTNNLVRTDPRTNYKVDVDLNAKTLDAKVNLENVPGITGPVKAQAKKLGENEYELQLADGSGAKKGTIAFKLTPDNQKFKVQTPAFQGNYESQWTRTKFSVLGEIVPDPKTPTSTYGVQLSNEQADPKSRDTSFTFSYPGRKISTRDKRVSDWPNNYQHTIEFNPNVGKREATKLDATANRQGLEIHLTDPKLPQGFHITGKKSSQGSYADENSPWSYKADFVIKYAADPKKQINLSIERKREPQQDRRKYSGSVEVSQEANNLKHKIWKEVMLEPCKTGDPLNCNYIFVIGTQFNDQQRQPQEYSVDLRTSLMKGTYLANFGKDKYKVDKTTVGHQRTYSVTKNNAPLYDIIAELVKEGEKKVSFSIVKKPANNVIFHASAGLPSSDIATFKVYHDESGKTVKDLEWTIKLEESDRLKMKFYKRPGLTKALNDLYNQNVQTAKAQATVPAFALANKAISDDIAKEMKPMFDDWLKEESAISKELQLQGGSITQVFIDGFQKIFEKLNKAGSEFGVYTADVAKVAQDMYRQFSDMFKQLAGQFPDIAKQLGPTFNEIKTKVQQRAQAFKDNAQQILSKVYADLKLQDVVNFIIRSWNQDPHANIVQKLRNLFQSIMGLFPEIKRDSMLADLRTKLGQIAADRNRQFQDAWAKVRADLVKTADGKQLADFIDSIINRIQSFFRDPERQSQELARGLGNWYQGLKANATAPKLLTVERPQEGMLIIGFPLPGHYNSLTDLGRSLTPARIKGLAHQLEDSLNDMSGMFEDQDDEEFLTPHESSALVFGDQNFETFDGEVFTFAGDCSYLLARDFEHGKFTITVDFERSAIKSVNVEYGDDKIEIQLSTGKVNINNKMQELPWHRLKEDALKADIKVTKKSDSVIQVESFDGMKMLCDFTHHFCAVKLSGRFHGKTKGLLGRNDGEPNDDITLPNGDKAQDIARFAGAWSLDQRCSNTPNKASTDALAKEHKMAEECNKLFKDTSSPLKSCFRSTPPEDFYDICMRNMKKFVQTQRDESRQNEGVCDVAAAYIKSCGQTIDMPPQCIRCEVPDVLKLYETKTITPRTSRTDVVFIVESRTCTSWTKTKLVGIAQKMGRDVNYGFVGFNGQGAHYLPHMHTGNGKLNMDVNDLQAAMANTLYAADDTIRGKRLNPMEAIEFVLDKYPFRGASRKIIVLITCSNCESFDIDYYFLQSELLGKGVTMYMVTAEAIRLGGNKPATVVGFDGRAMITQDRREDVDLRRELVEPHDSCTVLTQETNGTVFSYNAQNANTVLELLATRVSKSASEPTVCQVCECRSDFLHSHTVCLPCQMPTPASLTKDNSGFFNNPFQKLQKWQGKTQEVMMADAPAPSSDDDTLSLY